MPRVDLVLESNIKRSPRVTQLEGIFDVPAATKNRVEYHFDAPFEDKPWGVGLIVGPSGAGKSSVARALFDRAEFVEGYEWPKDAAVVDGFGKLPVKDVTGALSSVGFSSPPSWLRPFHVLSNGEQFRATMARALTETRARIVVDEFTSVVDRQVAKVASHTVQKAARARGKQFVAVTCHYDVEEWLQPDWVIEPHVGGFAWRSVQPRPRLKLDIVRCNYSSWRWFAHHHYLSANLNRGARCFVVLVGGVPVGFAGIIKMPHPVAKDLWRLSRVVVLPDYQGLGLGSWVVPEMAGMICKSIGGRLLVGSSHPAMVSALAKSPKWKLNSSGLAVPQGRTSKLRDMVKTTRRRVHHFVYAGHGFDDERDAEKARVMWN